MGHSPAAAFEWLGSIEHAPCCPLCGRALSPTDVYFPAAVAVCGACVAGLLGGRDFSGDGHAVDILVPSMRRPELAAVRTAELVRHVTYYRGLVFFTPTKCGPITALELYTLTCRHRPPGAPSDAPLAAGMAAALSAEPGIVAAPADAARNVPIRPGGTGRCDGASS